MYMRRRRPRRVAMHQPMPTKETEGRVAQRAADQAVVAAVGEPRRRDFEEPGRAPAGELGKVLFTRGGGATRTQGSAGQQHLTEEIWQRAEPRAVRGWERERMGARRDGATPPLAVCLGCAPARAHHVAGEQKRPRRPRSLEQR